MVKVDRPVVQLYRVGPGGHLQLQHHPGEVLERNRSAVDGGLPSGNVGEAKSQDLWADGVGVQLPRRGTGMGHPNGLARSVHRRQSAADCHWGQGCRTRIRDPIEIIVSNRLARRLRPEDLAHRLAPARTRRRTAVPAWLS